MEVRKYSPARALELAAELLVSIYEKNRRAAINCSADFPPHVESAMREQLVRAATITNDDVFQEDQHTFLVRSRINFSRKYRVSLQAAKDGDARAACECGFNMVSNSPCAHIIAAVRNQSLSLAEHHPYFSTDAWRGLYSGIRPKLPSSKEVEEHGDINDAHLRLPPAIPKRAGAPSKRKRISKTEI